MAFQVSPGVLVREIDLTTVVPAVGTTTGALAGLFQWGPVEERVLIDSAINLEKRFGKPDNETFVDWFSAYNFLSYANSLLIVRAANSTAKNAIAAYGQVVDVTIVNGGTGYHQATTTITFAAAPAGGTTATGTVTVTLGVITAVTITEKGAGYVTAPGITITDSDVAPGTSADLDAVLGSSILIKNEVDYDANYAAGQANVGLWTAKYPGELGNSLLVTMADSASFATWTTYKDLFSSAPAAGEVHVVVVDENGQFTGTTGTVLEKFEYLNKAVDSKSEDGSSNYYAAAINKSSQYVWWTDHPTGSNWGSVKGTTFSTISTPATYSLGGGVSGNGSAVAADYEDALDLFMNGDDVDISLVIGSSPNVSDISVVYQYIIDNIVDVRKDCVAFFSPQLDDVVNNPGNELDDCVTFFGSTVNRSTSYAVQTCNWKYQYDKYNDTMRWVPDNADIAGLCVRTDTDRDPWFSPAGFNRGMLKNVVKLAWMPSKAERDALYQAAINPVTSFKGLGPVLYGDKTALARPSAFDRINVRRLFIVLEKAIATAAKYSLFEFNDQFTRVQFRNLVEPFLRDVQGRRGIYDFRVVCDETNNTPEVIDRNEFIGDIYIKPARSINYITLNFVAVRTGVQFEEVVGKY
jgi:hypothetical protein